MQRINRLVSTVFGIGYFPFGPGTVTAAIVTLAWYFFAKSHPENTWQILVVLISTIVGIYCSNEVSRISGKDPSFVVIDEWAGMCIALLFIPPTIPNFSIALLLFRFFDIAKPLGIRKLESWKGGWGVMSDDILAGIYSNFVLRLILALKLW